MEDIFLCIANFAIDQAMLEAGESREGEEPLDSQDDENLVLQSTPLGRYALRAQNHMIQISREFDSAYGAM
jgi:hypothetical protein